MISTPAVLQIKAFAPNYVNPETRRHEVVICGAICFTIITIAISARLYTRAFIVRWFGTDDWLAIPAAFAGMVYCLVTIMAGRYGWYIHVYDLPATKISDAQKLIITASLLGLLNTAFTKISILCLYRRLSAEAWFRTMVNITLAFTVAWLIAMTVTNFLLCVPLRAYWDIYYKGQHKCFVLTPYFLSFAIIDLVLDVTVWTMPLFFIIPMRLPRRQKWTLLATFAIGVLTIAAAALRLPSLLRTSTSLDWSWELYHAAIWTQIEAAVGLFCASVPTLKPLIARFAPAILGTLSPSNSRADEENTGRQSTEYETTSDGKRRTITKTTNIKMSNGTETSKSDNKHDEDHDVFDFS